MKQFTLTLTLTLSADNGQDAYDIGVAACEHLADTFNDDGSISAEFEVSAQEVAGR